MLNLLYIEDDDIHALIMKKLLSNYHNVFHVRNSHEALEKVKQEYYDMVLMDLNLGNDSGADGSQLMQEIKKMPSYKNTKFLAISSFVFEDRQMILDSGFDELIEKPVSRAAILEKIGLIG